MRLFALFGLAFASASRERLTSPHTANSPAHSSVGTPSPALVAQHRLRLLVGSRFQVLFHSPPGGCFSPFPHGTGSLSVARECLALGWSPQIHTDFRGPVLLGMSGKEIGRVSPTGLLLPVAGPFHGLRLPADFVTPRDPPMWIHADPHDPDQATTSVYDT